MSSINKVTILGNLGQDPDTRYMPSGEAVTNLSIATSVKWTDKDSGEKKENTEWHKIVFFGRTAEVAAEYLKKGSKAYVEGRLRTRKWQDKDGTDRWTTEIVGKELVLVGAKSEGPAKREPAPPPSDDFDDDIPF